MESIENQSPWFLRNIQVQKLPDPKLNFRKKQPFIFFIFSKNGIPLFCFPPQQVFSRCIPMLTCLQQPPHQFFYPPIKIISPFLHRTSSLDPSPLAWSRQIHNPGARKKQHKETLAIPHNFYGNLVENEINDGESQIRIASGRCFADRCKVDEDTNIMGRSWLQKNGKM